MAGRFSNSGRGILLGIPKAGNQAGRGDRAFERVFSLQLPVDPET